MRKQSGLERANKQAKPVILVNAEALKAPIGSECCRNPLQEAVAGNRHGEIDRLPELSETIPLDSI